MSTRNLAHAHVCGKVGRREAVPCIACEVVEDEQEKAWGKGWCGSARSGLVCDREAGHPGEHRGYNWRIDEPMFWRRT
jgi:hypothetical protein